MGRKALISIIAITILIILVMFFFMWTLRPTQTGVASEILDKIAERQMKPLIEIEEPININVREVTEEELFASEVAERIVNDEVLVSAVVSRIINELPSSVSDSELSTSLAAGRAELSEVIRSASAEANTYTDASISSLNRQLRNYIQAELSRIGNGRVIEVASPIDGASVNLTAEAVRNIIDSDIFKAALEGEVQRRLRQISSAPTSL